MSWVGAHDGIPATHTPPPETGTQQTLGLKPEGPLGLYITLRINLPMKKQL